MLLLYLLINYNVKFVHNSLRNPLSDTLYDEELLAIDEHPLIIIQAECNGNGKYTQAFSIIHANKM